VLPLLAERAHVTNRLITLREVLVDARTFETNQATSGEPYEQAWKDDGMCSA
jgi:hypothetical protein